MVVERDETMFEMQRTINDLDDESRRLSRSLRELRDEVRDLSHRVPRGRPVEIIDLTEDDDGGIVVGENEVPLMVRTVVRLERDETVVPDSEAGTLVEIQEDRRATPQIVGEAEWLFERMERGGSVEQRAWDEEADYVARGTVAPEYEDPPPY